MNLKPISLLSLAFSVILLAGCGGGGGSSSSTDTSTSTSAQKGQAVATATGAIIGQSSGALGTAVGTSIRPKPRIDVGSAFRRFASSFDTTTNTLTLTNETVSGASGVTVSGTHTFTANSLTSPTGTLTYTASGGTSTLTMSNVSKSAMVSGTTYNLTLNGTMSLSISGTFQVGVVNGQASTMAFNMTVTPTANSDFAISGDVSATIVNHFTVALSGSGPLSTTQPSVACSGTVSYTLSTGETGSCTLSSDCSSCS